MQPHQSYRVFFRGPIREIVGREDFGADDDTSALVMAKVLWEACSDVASGYELWQGARCVTDRPLARRTPITWQELADCTQTALVEHELRMQSSNWAIARSRRLLVQLAHMRTLRLP